MSYAHLAFELDELGVALITVNRPQKLNALSAEVIGELGDAFGRVAEDRAIRAMIVTGAGEKAFSPGNDIGEFATERSNVEQAREYQSAADTVS